MKTSSPPVWWQRGGIYWRTIQLNAYNTMLMQARKYIPQRVEDDNFKRRLAATDRANHNYEAKGSAAAAATKWTNETHLHHNVLVPQKEYDMPIVLTPIIHRTLWGKVQTQESPLTKRHTLLEHHFAWALEKIFYTAAKIIVCHTYILIATMFQLMEFIDLWLIVMSDSTTQRTNYHTPIRVIKISYQYVKYYVASGCIILFQLRLIPPLQ